MNDNELREIEEIAKIMCGFPADTNCKECQKEYDISPVCGAVRAGIALYNAGYRKMPDGAVVLTREQYSNIICGIMDKANVSDKERLFITAFDMAVVKSIWRDEK